jgi:L-asparaginase
MRRTADGYAPSPGYLAQELEALPELRHADMPDWELHEHEPILDSSNLRPAHWLEIARDIVARADDFDGFVVLHGTDTMAYTASALAFMLRGLGKPSCSPARRSRCASCAATGARTC